MADASFDIVSKVDHQEADNALNQAAKELSQRFDFRGTDTTIAWSGEEGVTITSSTEERCKAAIDVFRRSWSSAASRCVRSRSVSRPPRARRSR